MTVRERWLWVAAMAVSLLTHAMLFLNNGSMAGNQESSQQVRHVTRVSFRSVTAPPTPPDAAPRESVPEPAEPEVTEAPEPSPPETVTTQSEQRSERARQIEPQPQSAVMSPASNAPSSAVADKLPATAEPVSGTVDEPALIEKAKQEYLRRLMARIEKYKHYPRTARRRHLEGDVRVSFNLLAGGQVAGLRVVGEHGILSDAAQRAVEDASPFAEPPPSLSLPWPVVFTMRFSLD